jgi:hypothetical protein
MPSRPRRYSPNVVTAWEARIITGNPSPDYISTSTSSATTYRSYGMRAFSRLTNDPRRSRTTRRLSPHLMRYSFARPHSSLGKNITPPMAAGITDHLWTADEIAALLERASGSVRPSGGPPHPGFEGAKVRFVDTDKAPTERLAAESGDVLRLVLPDAGVPFARLLDAQEKFLNLIREIGRTIAGDRGVVWIVHDTMPGSLDLGVHAVPTSARVRESVPREIADAVAGGMAMLGAGPRRPPHFTDAALERAKELANVLTDELPALTVRNGYAAARISSIVAAHAETVLGEPVVVFGSVEGTLESLTVHERRQFSVYDPLTDERIECRFGLRIPPSEIGSAIEKRVRVYGEIRSRETGQIMYVKADEIEVQPDSGTLPTADDVRGILSA